MLFQHDWTKAGISVTDAYGKYGSPCRTYGHGTLEIDVKLTANKLVLKSDNVFRRLIVIIHV